MVIYRDNAREQLDAEFYYRWYLLGFLLFSVTVEFDALDYFNDSKFARKKDFLI